MGSPVQVLRQCAGYKRDSDSSCRAARSRSSIRCWVPTRCERSLPARIHRRTVSGSRTTRFAACGTVNIVVAYSYIPEGDRMASLRVDALGIELLTDQSQLLDRGGRRGAQVVGDPRVPAGVLPNLVERDTRMQRRERHLTRRLLEDVGGEVRDDRRGSAPPPAARGVARRIARVSRCGAEVDLLHERPSALPHDHEDPPGVNCDLARTPGSREANLRSRVVADDRRVDVPEPIDLRGTEEGDIDQPSLE